MLCHSAKSPLLPDARNARIKHLPILRHLRKIPRRDVAPERLRESCIMHYELNKSVSSPFFVHCVRMVSGQRLPQSRLHLPTAQQHSNLLTYKPNNLPTAQHARTNFPLLYILDKNRLHIIIFAQSFLLFFCHPSVPWFVIRYLGTLYLHKIINSMQPAVQSFFSI